LIAARLFITDKRSFFQLPLLQTSVIVDVSSCDVHITQRL